MKLLLFLGAGVSVPSGLPTAANLTDRILHGASGECIAVGLPTAAVFHLMRIVELGMRGLAVNLGLLKVVVNRKTRKTVPVQFSEWEKILTQLPEKIEAKINALVRGVTKQKAQEFYYPMLKEITGFKDAWRNHVMHSRSTYTNEEAIAVLAHVERFMKSLAGYGIHEARRKKRAK